MSTVYEELARRLRRTDLLLLRAVRRQRARPAMRAKGQFWGSVITDDEVDALLRAHGEIDYPETSVGLGAAISASESLRDAPGGRLQRLRQAFQLGGDDADLILLSLAPEISAGYSKIFAYLNDNLNQGYLTVDLATRVLRTERIQRLQLQARLMSASPLVKNRLLLLNPPDGAETHTSRRVHPSGRLLRWLLEEEELPSSPGFVPLDVRISPFVPGSTKRRLEEFDELDRAITYVIVGAAEGSREGVALEIARRVKRPLVRVDLERCMEYLEQPWDLIRECRLARAIPYLINLIEAQDDPGQRLRVIALGSTLASLDCPVLVGAADRRSVKTLLGTDRPSVTIMCGKSTFPERIDAWTQAFEERGWDPTPAPEIAERFYAIGGTTIDRVMKRADAESGGRPPKEEVLWAAAREGARPEFRGLAQHVVPRYQWDDLILEEKVKGKLQGLVDYIEHQETVFHRWGARDVRARGYGIKALFSGGPGTGKTMAAEVIANQLGLDMFKVDISQVISRWVGETEKNLKEIFDAAEGGTAVILFDEADALFGSRGEVKQAQDRFANQEVSFLLQRLEVFEGAAILTTNLQENIDAAFLRRFGAVVEFPMPSPEQRLELWERAIPKAAPRADDVELHYIADQFILSGGPIVNAAINACILAATEDTAVHQRHVVRAVGMEMIKMGKQVNRVHFGDFWDQVEDLV
ncbi:MAG TPA: ATP-binding protein [Myxococcota bacterium]|nr:ATP-binding protein [Myxococcota bacterium]